MTFEEQLQQLQQFTQKLENETLPLEEALSIYQQGIQSVKACREALEAAESKFTLLTEEVPTV